MVLFFPKPAQGCLPELWLCRGYEAAKKCDMDEAREAKVQRGKTGKADKLKNL